MNYLPLLQVFSYVCGLIFIVAFTIKAISYARMPIHLRWELYPIVSDKDRPYGGSYHEDLDWWHRPLRRSPGSELKYMISEVLLFREYFRRNRPYWYFVYPFHIGIFLFVVWLLILFIQTLFTTGPISSFNIASLIIGLAGLVIGTAGTAGIIVKRLYSEDLRNYTSPRDIFDLLLIAAVFVSGICSWYFSGLSFSGIVGYFRSLFTFGTTSLNPATIIFILLLGILFAYMPFTKMMHYLAKYFTYHKVRWDDKPNLPGSNIEKKVQQVLNKRVSWSAPHAQPGKTWAETVNNPQDSKK